MNLSEIPVDRGGGWLRRFTVPVLAAALITANPAHARADEAPLAGVPSEARVTGFATHWFTEMQAGRTDRALYAPAYAAQLNDTAVRELSKALNAYGGSPVSAELVQARKGDTQTFYIVKFRFPRGDATSLIFGFDSVGKITAVAIGGLAGD